MKKHSPDIDPRLVPFDMDAFYRLALGDGTTNLESYSWKSTASSSHNTTHQSATEVELGEELRQTKELVQ
jgi:hypothetical protein